MRPLLLEATPQDAETIYHVMQSAYAEYKHMKASSGALKETIESIREKLSFDGEQALLLYDQLKPVGMVRFKLEEEGLYFFRLSITPEARGKGYAQLLIQELEKIALLQGKKSIYCRVRKSIKKNVQLYEKQGYRVFDEEIIYKPDGIVLEVISMQKQLLAREELALITLSPAYKDQYTEMVEEWKNQEERINPAILRMDYTDFNQVLMRLYECEQGINIPEGHVSHSTYFLVKNSLELVGAINLRHHLNERLLLTEGHLGGGIRPSQRRKGYARIMLELALKKIKEEHGINHVLVTCNKGNIGSEKAILANGGILENEYLEENGNTVMRYWIQL